jgi:chromate reductase
VSGQARILLVTGSTRARSASTAALATAAAIAPTQVTPVRYDGLAELPAFNPDDDGDRLPAAAGRLRAEIGKSDAVLFCTPEYAGTLPGSLKNLLDWTVGGGEFDRKPAAWINVAVGGRGQGAQQTLASVLGYVGADIVEAACRRIPVEREAIGPDGTVIGLPFAVGIAEVWDALLSHLGKL